MTGLYLNGAALILITRFWVCIRFTVVLAELPEVCTVH